MRTFLLTLPFLALLTSCQAPLHGDPRSEWRLMGGATYLREPGQVIHGIGRDLPRNSFLVSMEEYADFELTVDVRIDGGNSGIQIRSHENAEGGFYGYQIEIDPSPRGWSGGLYDEGRRGWLDSNEGKEAARAAFDVEGWNRYRIVCEGDRIRTWVNDVPCADFRDDADDSGHIGLQVHGGAKTDVWWRGLSVRRL
jgi:hypothetical protein